MAYWSDDREAPSDICGAMSHVHTCSNELNCDNATDTDARQSEADTSCVCGGAAVGALKHMAQAAAREAEPRGGLDPTQPDIYFEEVRLHSPQDPRCGSYVMPIVTLRTPRCRWAASGGCIMCGYGTGAVNDAVSAQELIQQTQCAIDRLNPDTYPAVVFTSNGSFLDPHEVPDTLRFQLLALWRTAGFRFVVCETRPEFVTPERLEAAADALGASSPGGGRGLSVSLGLESANDFVLQFCLNKGERVRSYDRAFGVLRDQRVSFDCYVLLGKPFMTAQEDVADAIDAVRFAVEQGADYVFVMVVNLMPGTLLARLDRQGAYELPSLWRAVELLSRLGGDLRHYVQVKAFAHAPYPPQRFAATCPGCHHEVKDALNFWNQTADFQHIEALSSCACRTSFLEEEWNHTPRTSLGGRVASGHKRLADSLGIPRSETEALVHAVENCWTRNGAQQH